MPSLPIRNPQRDSLEEAARQIYEILDLEDRKRPRTRGRLRSRRADGRAALDPWTRDSAAAIDADAREQEPAPGYGPLDWISDRLAGVGPDGYENYVGAKAALSEMVGSQLPGRERGPADAYRHLLWAAELTRRFGENRAREILGLHEREGEIRRDQPQDEESMDLHNNEIGVSIGRFARNWPDVVHAVRKVIAGSAPGGGGGWQADYDTGSTLAPYGANWLPERRWANNPKADGPGPLIGRGTRLPPAEIPTEKTNWYGNPDRPTGPDWVAGYVPDGYSYPFGQPANAVGANDAQIRRAIGAYKRYLDWLRWWH